VEVILRYNGTINEIIGDAMLVIFGAPQEMPDRAQQAIACAIEMQNKMAEVNERNRSQGLPELEMGIGLNETEVIVGNIGSVKRSKYGAVGSGVSNPTRLGDRSLFPNPCDKKRVMFCVLTLSGMCFPKEQKPLLGFTKLVALPETSTWSCRRNNPLWSA
jgi:hypothetical protein